MSLFRPFEPNPFRVNAFTITGVLGHVTSGADIDVDVKARAHEIEDGRDCGIPLAGGELYSITAADLTRNEEILRDPNQRHREALLAPAERRIEEPPAIAAFRSRFTLSRQTAEAFLSLEPLDAAGFLIAGLPQVPPDQLVWPAPDAPLPPAEPIVCPPGAMLARARDRRG
jgi:hypothetical protein